MRGTVPETRCLHRSSLSRSSRRRRVCCRPARYRLPKLDQDLAKGRLEMVVESVRVRDAVHEVTVGRLLIRRVRQGNMPGVPRVAGARGDAEAIELSTAPGARARDAGSTLAWPRVGEPALSNCLRFQPLEPGQVPYDRSLSHGPGCLRRSDGRSQIPADPNLVGDTGAVGKIPATAGAEGNSSRRTLPAEPGHDLILAIVHDTARMPYLAHQAGQTRGLSATEGGEDHETLAGKPP